MTVSSVESGYLLVGLDRFLDALGKRGVRVSNDAQRGRILMDLQAATFDVEDYCRRKFVPRVGSTHLYSVPSSSTLLVHEYLVPPSQAPRLYLFDQELIAGTDFEWVRNEAGTAYWEAVRLVGGAEVPWTSGIESLSRRAKIRVVGVECYAEQVPAPIEFETVAHALNVYVARAHMYQPGEGGYEDFQTQGPSSIALWQRCRLATWQREEIEQIVDV